MKRFFLIASIALYTLCAQHLYGQTVTVVESAVELQNAVTAASEGDIIRLSPSFPDSFSALITLTIDSPNSFTIDGGSREYLVAGAFQHFNINKPGEGTLTFQNFFLTGRRTSSDGFSGGLSGGGLNLGNNTKGVVKILNSKFTAINSSSVSFSGQDSLAHLIFEKCTFKNNRTGGHGGALYITGKSFTTIEHSTFDENYSAGAGYSGGAITYFSYTGSASIKNSVFINNKAIQWGGAISVYSSKAPEGSKAPAVSIDASYFEKNITTRADGVGDGGAISVYGGVNSGVAFSVSNSTFYDNTAADDGGAIFLENQAKEGGINTITSCLMYKNTATDVADVHAGFTVTASGGGAIQASLATTVTIESSTIIGNTAVNSKHGGGGLGVHSHLSAGSAARFLLKNSVVLGNTSPLAVRSNISVRSAGHAVNNGGNIGIDNGKALLPDITMENTFGDTPLLWSNFSNVMAGNPNDASTPGYYLTVPSIAILPNDGVSVLGLANQQGDATSLVTADQRGYSRNQSNPDIGSVEIRWICFDAQGGSWSGLSAQPYDGQVYHWLNTLAEVEKYYQISYAEGTITAPVPGNPTKDGFEFSYWSFASDGSYEWNEASFFAGDTNHTLYAIWKSLGGVFDISATATDVVEGGDAVKVTICLAPGNYAPVGGIPVDLTKGSEFNVENSDYTLADNISNTHFPATITIPVGERCIPFNITAVLDDLIEGPETFTIKFSAAGFPDDSLTLTVIDRTIGDIIVKAENDNVSESGGVNAKFWIGFREDVKAVKSVKVTYVVEGAAEESRDYESIGLPPHSVVIPAGIRGVEFEITPKDNFVVEGDRTVEIKLEKVEYI